MKIAADLNIPVKESVIPREMVYLADEVFFVGTAVEVTPIQARSTRLRLEREWRVRWTRKIQEEFFALTSGKKADRHGWMTPVSAPVAAGQSSLAEN